MEECIYVDVILVPQVYTPLLQLLRLFVISIEAMWTIGEGKPLCMLPKRVKMDPLTHNIRCVCVGQRLSATATFTTSHAAVVQAQLTLEGVE